MQTLLFLNGLGARELLLIAAVVVCYYACQTLITLIRDHSKKTEPRPD